MLNLMSTSKGRDRHQHNSIKQASHFHACEKQRSQSDKELSFFPTSSLGIELTFPWQLRQSLSLSFSLPPSLPHAFIISLSSVYSLDFPFFFYRLFVWTLFLFYKVASDASAF